MLTFIKKHRFVFLFTCIYACIIIFVSPFHEVWRDEVRALNYATEARSIPELFKNLHNEGHPALWHLILNVGYNIFHTKVILKIFNIIISIIAVFIFLLKSPFSKLQKALFIFGYYPLYGYSIINRSYALAMLLLFIICVLYKKRFEKIILYSVALFLFVNTHVLSLIIGYGFFISLLVEYIVRCFQKTHGRYIQHAKTLVGLAIIIFGMSISFLQAYPDSRATFSKLNNIDANIFIQRNEQALLLPGASSASAFGTTSAIFVVLIFWIINIYLFSKKPFLFIIFFIGNYLSEFLFITAYNARIWHQGMIFMSFIAIMWLDQENNDLLWFRNLKTGVIFDRISDLYKRNKMAILYILLIIQSGLSFPVILQDIFGEFSSSKKLAYDIRADKTLDNAIIIGEPDHFVETLAYYINNPIYIAREKRFGKTVKWTIDNESDLTLDEFLETAKDVHEKYRVPVIITFSFKDFGWQGPLVRKVAFNRTFSYSQESLNKLLRYSKFFGRYKKSYGLIEELGETDTENYYVYVLSEY